MTAVQRGSIRTLPTGRLMAVDDDGRMLRASWHLERGFVNLSLWRDDRCVETFHLTIEDAARLTGFLVEGFAEVTAAATDLEHPAARSEDDASSATPALRRWYEQLMARARRSLP